MLNLTTIQHADQTRLAGGKTPVVQHPIRPQQGAVLLAMLGIIVLFSAALLLSRLNAAVAPTSTRDPVTAKALASAKEALIAWAATHPDTPGLLPFPDRNDEVTNPNYDGAADCVAPGTVASTHLLGSFPIRGTSSSCASPQGVATGGSATSLVDSGIDFVAAGVSDGDLVRNLTDGSMGRVAALGVTVATLTLEGLTLGAANSFTAGDAYVVNAPLDISLDVVDSSGARLWYAVSQNLVPGGDGGLINPDIGELGEHPWITVRDQSGAIISCRVAAVIIAPGAALAGQDRSGIAPAAANYLDSFSVGGNTYDNADADGGPDALAPPCGPTPGEEFIVNPTPAAGDNFNDRLVFITVDELMAAVQDRVLGDAALAMKSYRNSYTVPAPFYPWMSSFSNPRATQGRATSGSGAITLEDTGTNFVAAGVLDGYLVRNLSDGSIGPVKIGGVTANTLTVDGLIGGTANTFTTGDRYVVHAPSKFQGSAGTVEGMLPLHYPNEVFQTGFTVNWDYAGEANDDPWLKGDDGNPALIPTENDVDNFSFNSVAGDVEVLPANGKCKWTTKYRVDCWGTAIISPYTRSDPPYLVVDRTVEVWFNFTANPADTTITAPTATKVRRRSHTYDGPNYGPVPALPAPDMPQKWSVGNPCASGCAWTVHIEDTDGSNSGWRRAERDGNTDLVINKFEGIRYEIGVPDELPAWFVENNWQQFVHAAIAGSNLPATLTTSGDGACTSPPTGAGNESDDCLTLNYNSAMVREDVEALVIGSGGVLAAVPQDRDAATACAPRPAFLCDYFEAANSDAEATSRSLFFGRTPNDTFSITTTFNDHVRPVPP